MPSTPCTLCTPPVRAACILFNEEGMKRPRPCRSYPRHIHVRATDAEQRCIYALARASRVSASRYLVRLATEGKAPPTLEERELLRSLRFLLEKIGTNLNQLAHRANRAAIRGEPFPPREEILAVLNGVSILSRALKRRLL